MKKIFLIATVLCLSLAVSAQENEFLIYSVKGSANVVENKVETKAKIGKLMNQAAVLKVPAGSAVTLICNEAAMFTITKAGTYSMSQFKDSCQVSNSSVSANYVKYVWNQMTKSTGSPGSNRKLFMNTVGAVSRSVNNIWIDPRLDTVNYAGGDFPLSWKSYADAKEFDFSLFPSLEGGKAMFSTVVSKLKIPIPKFKAQLKPGNTYYWTAAVKGEENPERKIFNYVSAETLNQLIAELKSAGPDTEGAAEQAYRLAFSLEDAHYLADAYTYYLKAATLKPDMPLYRSTLMSFRTDYEIK